MSPDTVHELKATLARIDERVKAVQEDLREIHETRRCHTHREKIRVLERMVWGCAALITGVAARMIYDAMR